jgi:RNA polymerase sigma-70 factor (ECF subfamily)
VSGVASTVEAQPISGEMADPERDSVVEQARVGDDAAFAELYHRQRSRVFSLCLYMLRSREGAEDATSEVFLRVQKALGSYDPALPFAGWLTGIASNHCIDVLRRRSREQRLFVPEDPELPVAAVTPSPLTLLADQETRDRVRKAIGRLDDRYRIPLVLRYFSDLSYDEIAAQTGLKRSYVPALLFRAKEQLRRVLEIES